MTEIKNQLLFDPEKRLELEYFLSTNYNLSTFIDGDKVLYGDYLIIEYSKKNKIKSIQVDEKKLSIKKLIEDVKEALDTSNEIQIDSKIIFSPVIIEKYFRYKNEFQILPAPSYAPKIDRSYIGASHPFTLEYSFLKSTNIWINSFRSSKKYHEIVLLLNSLLKHGIELIPNSQKQEWAMIIGENNFKCEYLHLGYQLNETDNRTKDGLGFTITNNYEQFNFNNFEEYYSKPSYSSDDFNEYLPSNFTSSIEKYHLLPKDKKEKFLNSSYWTQVASNVFSTSMSVAFSSLVTSIEVFLPDPKERCLECNKPVSDEICSVCSQPSAGPTKYFREFIEAHSPGIDVKLRNELYNLRSSILHGGKLMTSDQKYLGHQHNSESRSGIDKWYLLNGIIKLIQNNWLNS
jgi:hypothetical protein